jgi:tetratricopeptide (TPR) repeat protein
MRPQGGSGNTTSMELSTHVSGNGNASLFGGLKKAMTFRHKSKPNSKKLASSSLSKGGQVSLSMSPKKKSSSGSGGVLKKVTRPGKENQPFSPDGGDVHTTPSSYYKKADQAKRSKPHDNGHGHGGSLRRTLLSRSKKTTAAASMTMMTVQSTPDTVATSTSSSTSASNYSMGSSMHMTPASSRFVLNMTPTPARACTSTISEEHESRDDDYCYKSASTRTLFTPQSMTRTRMDSSSVTTAASSALSSARHTTTESRVRVAFSRSVAGDTTPQTSTKQRQLQQHQMMLQEEADATPTPVRELFLFCTPAKKTPPLSSNSSNSNNSMYGSGSRHNKKRHEHLMHQQDVEGAFQLEAEHHHGDDWGEDEYDNESEDQSMGSGEADELVNLFHSMGPISSSSTKSIAPPSQESLSSCLDLPQTLLRRGMFQQAVSLLQDPRFIQKRLQTLEGHLASAARLHVRDLKRFKTVVTTKHEKDQKAAAALATPAFGNMSTPADRRAALIAQRRAISMQSLGHGHTNAQHHQTQVGEADALVHQLPTVIFDAFRSFMSVTISISITAATQSSPNSSSSSSKAEDQLQLLEVLMMATRCLRRLGWPQKALELCQFFIESHTHININTNANQQQQQEEHSTSNSNSISRTSSLDYSNTNVAVASAKLFIHMGRLQTALDHYEDAVASYQVALSLLETTDNRLEYCSTLVKMGHLHCRFGCLEESLRCYQDVYDVQRMVFGESSLEMGFLLNNMGVIQRHMGMLEEALETYMKCHAVLKLQLTSDHLHVAHASNNIAGVLRRMGRHGEALDMYQHVLEVKKRHLPKYHASIALTHAAMGATLRAQGGGAITNEAMVHYRAALK